MDFQIRDHNGVAIRRDGKGDFWANEHRRKLGNKWHMRDSDETHRCSWEIQSGENLVYSEMVFDSYQNRGKLIRRCATLCRYERKKTISVAERAIQNGDVGLAHLCQECRNDKACQSGLGGRLFLICGDSYPLTYIEIDPETGCELGRSLMHESNWHELYRDTGLDKGRHELERWLLAECREVTNAS
jgi:hypothetical protein